MFHRTREGVELPIAAMSDDHLIATIELFLKPMQSLTEALRSSGTTAEQSARSIALYGKKQRLSQKKAQEIHESTYRKVGPYVLEAALRGLGIRPYLTTAFGRMSADTEAPSVTDVPNALEDDTPLWEPPHKRHKLDYMSNDFGFNPRRG